VIIFSHSFFFKFEVIFFEGEFEVISLLLL